MTRYLPAIALVACSSPAPAPNLADWIPPDGGEASARAQSTCAECQQLQQGSCICVGPGVRTTCTPQTTQNPISVTASVLAGGSLDIDLGITDQPTVCAHGYICLATSEAPAGAHYLYPAVTADRHWHAHYGSLDSSPFSGTIGCWPMLTGFVQESHRVDAVYAPAGTWNSDPGATVTVPIDVAHSVSWMAGWSGNFSPGQWGSYVGINSVTVGAIQEPQAVAYSAVGQAAAWGVMMTVDHPSLTPQPLNVSYGASSPLDTPLPSGMSSCGFLYQEGPSAAGFRISWMTNGIFLSSADNETPGVAGGRCAH